MRLALLCRERLFRILDVLEQQGGHCSLRDLFRSFSIYGWEVEQAADAGWLVISLKKPAVGRPSVVVEKLSKLPPAKLPPSRNAIPCELSIRHERFVRESISIAPSRNAFGFGLQSATDAYLRAFPRCKSRAAASASASRLMKRPMIQAARLWYRKTEMMAEQEPMPPTPAEVFRRLNEMSKF